MDYSSFNSFTMHTQGWAWNYRELSLDGKSNAIASILFKEAFIMTLFLETEVLCIQHLKSSNLKIPKVLTILSPGCFYYTFNRKQIVFHFLLALNCLTTNFLWTSYSTCKQSVVWSNTLHTNDDSVSNIHYQMILFNSCLFFNFLNFRAYNML